MSDYLPIKVFFLIGEFGIKDNYPVCQEEKNC